METGTFPPLVRSALFSYRGVGVPLSVVIERVVMRGREEMIQRLEHGKRKRRGEGEGGLGIGVRTLRNEK